MAKLKVDFYDPSPDCQRIPVGATVELLRPHLWAGKTAIVEKEKDGAHQVLIKGALCDFQATAPGRMLKIKL